KATIDLALQREPLREELVSYFREIVEKEGHM
ncbi:UTP--glucose-1-phosphate uridylyltransferase, partial [Priestia megaterium]